MELDGGEREFLGHIMTLQSLLLPCRETHLSNVTVFNARSFVQVFAFNPLSSQAAASYGGATTERLELGISDFTLLINLAIFIVKTSHQFSVFLTQNMLQD